MKLLMAVLVLVVVAVVLVPSHGRRVCVRAGGACASWWHPHPVRGGWSS